MNIDLSYHFKWHSNLYLPDLDPTLCINEYSMDITMTTRSTNQQDLNTAVDRIKVFVYDILANAVFIDRQHTNAIENLRSLKCHIAALPSEPMDHVLGLVLLSKLNSIMAGRIEINQLSIASSLGDNVFYISRPGDQLDVDYGTGWWCDAGPEHEDVARDLSEKVAAVIGPSSWAEWNLLWSDQTAERRIPCKEKGTTVVYADFGKNEKNPV
jgi:hypothetical protein